MKSNYGEDDSKFKAGLSSLFFQLVFLEKIFMKFHMKSDIISI